MGKLHVRNQNGAYRKRPEYCKGHGCHAAPAPGRKYCETCLAKEREQGIADRLNRRLLVMQTLGGVQCAVPGCPIRDPLMLEIDHVLNDGHKDRVGRFHHPVVYMRVLLKLCRTNPEEARRRFQVLCSGHNKQKEIYRARGWEWTLEIASKRFVEFCTGLANQPRT